MTPAEQASIHGQCRTEVCAVLKAQQELVFFRNGSGIRVQSQPDAVTEHEGGTREVDLNHHSETFGRLNNTTHQA